MEFLPSMPCYQNSQVTIYWSFLIITGISKLLIVKFWMGWMKIHFFYPNFIPFSKSIIWKHLLKTPYEMRYFNLVRNLVYILIRRSTVIVQSSRNKSWVVQKTRIYLWRWGSTKRKMAMGKIYLVVWEAERNVLYFENIIRQER